MYLPMTKILPYLQEDWTTSSTVSYFRIEIHRFITDIDNIRIQSI